MIHLSGFDVNIIPLLLLGLGVGVLSGFTGVGGGFVVTPALIILGVPADLAVGTSLFWVFLNSLAGSIIHRNRGNADIKLGLCLSLPSLFGVEAGIRLAHYMRSVGMQDVAILSVSILLMVCIGVYTLFESLKRKATFDQAEEGMELPSRQTTMLARRLQAVNLPPRVKFPRSGVTISIWIILALGYLIGIITGFVGVGGGFMIVPALTYVVGTPAILAVGSSTVHVVVSSFYGGGRYLLSGDVVIPLALILLSTSIPGVFFGASATMSVRGVAIKLVLGLTITIVCLGSIFKLTWFLFDKSVPFLEISANIVTFTGIILSVLIVTLLQWGAGRREKGKPISRALTSLFRRP
jgi:uncharacterized protein